MNTSDPPGAARLGVVITDRLGRPLRDPGIARWLSGVAPRSAAGGMAIALVRDTVMRRLNREYAGHDYATDVLSFPEPPTPTPSPRGGRGRGRALTPTLAPSSGRGRGGAGNWLGDVVIATGVSRRQAAAAGHAWRTELRILALHGLLHLLGYDHTNDEGAMARAEGRLRRKGGLREALIERAHRPAGRRRPGGRS